MKNTRGLCWILAGAVLLAAALSLCLYNWHQSIRSGETAQEVLTVLKEELPPLPNVIQQESPEELLEEDALPASQ